MDPGIDHLYAMKMIDQVHEEGGKVSLDMRESRGHTAAFAKTGEGTSRTPILPFFLLLEIDEFWSWCGGLAEPEAAKVMAGGKPNPLEYKVDHPCIVAAVMCVARNACTHCAHDCPPLPLSLP